MIGEQDSRSSPELILNEIACPNAFGVTSNRQSLQSGLSKRVKRFFKLSVQVLRCSRFFGPYLQQVSAKLVKSAALKIWDKCVNFVPLRSLDEQMTFSNIGSKTLKEHLSSRSRGGQGFCSRSLMAWRWRGVQSLEMYRWCLVKIFCPPSTLLSHCLPNLGSGGSSPHCSDRAATTRWMSYWD